MDFYDELVGLTDALGELNIDYAVCGGIALAIHGHPRFTQDIDLLVSPRDLDRILDVARGLGFTVEGGLLTLGPPGPDTAQLHRVSKVEDEDFLTLDLILLNPGLQAVWDDRKAFSVQGRDLMVVSRTGLIQMKRLAGRGQDLVDLDQMGANDGN